MLKITLLHMLYHEFDRILQKEGYQFDKAERNMRRLQKIYPDIPEIQSVTMEERFLPKSVLYYAWVNGKMENLDNHSLCRWIYHFVLEYCPAYLRDGLPEDPIQKGISILDCFEVSRIPDYRKNRAYSELTITTMDDVKNHKEKADTRQATFPGIRFSEKYKDRKV